MSKNISCGILLFRRTADDVEVMLVHPGGELNKDRDIWGIPKGISNRSDADFLQTAIREFHEETGVQLDPSENYIYLGMIENYSKKKSVAVFALEKDIDVSGCVSNTCEYPKGSGIIFPEVDAYQWFDLDTAQQKIHPKQEKFLLELFTRTTTEV